MADLFFPRPNAGTGLAIWKRALEEKKGRGQTRVTGGCKIPEGTKGTQRSRRGSAQLERVRLHDCSGGHRQEHGAQRLRTMASGTQWGHGPALCDLLQPQTLNCFICEIGKRIIPPS